ncbi:MAG: flagellar assembly protein H, partial [Bacteroidota bacterium]
RKLEYVFSENAKDMPLTFDIKEDHFYQKGVAEGKTEGRVEGRAEGKAEGRVEGRVEGRAEGKAEGKIEGKIEMIINLLSEGMPIKKIAAIADLPIDQIQEIKKQHKL